VRRRGDFLEGWVTALVYSMWVVRIAVYALVVLAVLFVCCAPAPALGQEPRTPSRDWVERRRVLLADMPYRKVVPAVTLRVLPPTHVEQLPPYNAYEVEYPREHTVIDYARIPSNQDIKDGVERPVDTLKGFTSYGHDYYAEYRLRYGYSPEDRP
jgi:hypothetical protein